MPQDRTERDMDAAYRTRTPDYTRQALQELFLRHHEKVSKPPKYNKETRRYTCGDPECGASYKSVQELERHYTEAHASG
ncbi:MAG: hypothetical protein KY455_05970 [Euryarchaeota archaeon]|nr:hypothetical protein [Euryarchaeota archaeon]